MTLKKILILVTLLAAAVTGFTAIVIWRKGRVGAEAIVKPGSIVFELVDTLVTKVEYLSNDRRLLIEREGATEAPFLIRLQDKNGRSVDQCRAGSAFIEILGQLTSIHARRGLSESEVEEIRRTSSNRSQLSISAAGDDESLHWEIVISKAHPTTVFALDREIGYELIVSPKVFERLAQGCIELAK